MDFGSLLGKIGKAALAIGGVALTAALASKANNKNGDGEWSDKDCDWYCDNCGEFMNDQPGFNTISGTWICQNCGEENDVSDDNVWEEYSPYDPEYDE